jgi:8-hydroxy-5-deazaflavin:NADPH oxidoreductase
MSPIDRRRLLQLGAGAAFAPLALSSPLFAQTPGTTKIGIIGSGRVGGTIGKLWAKAGYQVMFSSRHPEELKSLTEGLGTSARTGTVTEAAKFGDVIFIAVPYAALPAIGRENTDALKGKVRERCRRDLCQISAGRQARARLQLLWLGRNGE